MSHDPAEKSQTEGYIESIREQGDAMRHRTWVGTIYEDELMPEMSAEMYDEWYAKSYLVDGVRCGELPRSYHLKQLLALRRQAFEELQVYDAEIEMLLDGDSREQEILRRVSDCPRYDCVEDDAHRATMKHDKTGDWILFDDATQAVESVTKGDSYARP